MLNTYQLMCLKQWHGKHTRKLKVPQALTENPWFSLEWLRRCFFLYQN